MKISLQTILKRIAHGFLTASLISTVIASDLPGPGSIYLSQTLKFLAPVYFNDEIIVKVKIIELNKEKKRVKLLTECTKNNALILAGEAVIIVESKNQKNNESFQIIQIAREVL